MSVVWATLRGFPPWPAEVTRYDEMSAKFTVRFFATDNEAALPEQALQRYRKKQLSLRTGRGKAVQSEQLKEQFFRAVKLADEALDEDQVAEPLAAHTDMAQPTAEPPAAAAANTSQQLAALPPPSTTGASSSSSPAMPLRGPASGASIPPPSVSSLDGITAVHAALRAMRLGTYGYGAVLEEDGWDDLRLLASFDTAYLEEIGREARMRPGHALKFALWLLPTARRMAAAAGLPPEEVGYS